MTMSYIQPTVRMTIQTNARTSKNYKTTKRKREKHFLYYDGLVLKQVV